MVFCRDPGAVIADAELRNSFPQSHGDRDAAFTKVMVLDPIADQVVQHRP
jgi:hypothetical protein